MQRVTVHTGTNLLSQTGSAYSVESATAHPNYNSRTIANDVAVIRVSRPISFNAKVRAISLTGRTVSDGSSCVLSGWGTLKVSETFYRLDDSATRDLRQMDHCAPEANLPIAT